MKKTKILKIVAIIVPVLMFACITTAVVLRMSMPVYMPEDYSSISRISTNEHNEASLALIIVAGAFLAFAVGLIIWLLACVLDKRTKKTEVTSPNETK